MADVVHHAATQASMTIYQKTPPTRSDHAIRAASCATAMKPSVGWNLLYLLLGLGDNDFENCRLAVGNNRPLIAGQRHHEG